MTKPDIQKKVKAIAFFGTCICKRTIKNPLINADYCSNPAKRKFINNCTYRHKNILHFASSVFFGIIYIMQ